MTKQADLIAYVLDEQPHLLSDELMGWMEASARFTSFVETYRDKIRKKIRVILETESVLDLRSELEVAACLLNDRRLGVVYEPYASVKRRGPDFAVTYRANLVFNVEVARLRLERSGEDSAGLPREEGGSAPSLAHARSAGARAGAGVLRILLYKLGQMQPGMANLLVIHTRGELARSIELDRLMQEVKTRIEGKDASFYTTSRYATPSAFYKDFLRLSGILIWAPDPKLWVNKQARPQLAENVLRLVRSLASGGGSRENQLDG